MALCSFVWLYLVIGAVAFNGKEAYPKDPTDEKSDFSCDEKGYLEYLSKWGDAKGTSRDVKSEEFKKRLEYFKQSCKTIHRGSGKRRYKLEFTFYADWAPEEFEEITASVVRYKGVQPETEVIPIVNNTNYRYLMPSMDPCDGNGELRELISKPQNCSVSWAFAITNSIEYAIKKMYFEEYDQIVEVSLSAQELIDCVGENGEDSDGEYDEKKGGCAGFSLASGFDYVSLYGIAYSESYPHRNEKGACRRKEIGEEHRYRIAGYEKPVTYNKLGLFDLMKRGPVAVTMGLDPQYFQYYRSDRDGEFYFDSSSNQPSVYGVVMEYSQFAVDGKDELAKYPYFAVETRLRGCDSMVFRLPILDTVENANVGGIAGLAIRPIVTEMVEVKPTVVPTVVPTTQSPTEQPTTQPTTQPTNPPTQSPTIHPTTVLPTTQPTEQPTIQPTHTPTIQPTNPPTSQPTSLPTTQPTNPPTQSPTEQPTTVLPTTQPTEIPTIPSTPTITLTSCSQLDSLPSQLPSVTQLILSSEFDCDGTVDLKRFENCESIVIGSNAMENATSLDLSGMESLKSIEIGDGSYPALTEIIVGSTEFSQLTNVTIGSNSLNSLTSLLIFPSLRSVTIGANSLTSVKQLVISESLQLDDVTIGEGSLSGVEDLVLGNAGQRRRLADSGMTRYSGMSAFGLHSDGSGYIFSMNNRSVLRNVKKIEVKENSYNNVHRFEVSGLIKLERIVVGPNSICGEGETSAFMVEECPSLQTVTIGDGSLREYGMVVMRENANLTRVELGAWSFNKAWSVELRGRSEWMV